MGNVDLSLFRLRKSRVLNRESHKAGHDAFGLSPYHFPITGHISIDRNFEEAVNPYSLLWRRSFLGIDTDKSAQELGAMVT